MFLKNVEVMFYPCNIITLLLSKYLKNLCLCIYIYNNTIYFKFILFINTSTYYPYSNFFQKIGTYVTTERNILLNNCYPKKKLNQINIIKNI